MRFNWLLARTQTGACSKRRSGFRPALELLEDRLAPATTFSAAAVTSRMRTTITVSSSFCGEACAHVSMRLIGYCSMPNHFHLVVWPHEDGDLSTWMQWLLTTHVHGYREHAAPGRRVACVTAQR
jgi:hypothetical protein